jgi:hypothetical protein
LTVEQFWNSTARELELQEEAWRSRFKAQLLTEWLAALWHRAKTLPPANEVLALIDETAGTKPTAPPTPQTPEQIQAKIDSLVKQVDARFRRKLEAAKHGG